jgi:hypothetical protein
VDGCVVEEDAFDVLGMEVAAPEAVDDAAKLDVHTAADGGHVREERRRAAGRVGAVEHGHAGDVSKRVADAFAGEGAERADFEQADGLALPSELVDDVLHRAAARAEADDHVARAVERVRLDRAVAPPGERLELRLALGRGPARRLQHLLLPAPLRRGDALLSGHRLTS